LYAEAARFGLFGSFFARFFLEGVAAAAPPPPLPPPPPPPPAATFPFFARFFFEGVAAVMPPPLPPPPPPAAALPSVTAGVLLRFPIVFNRVQPLLI
jgi:hypothetical protein